MEEIWKDVTEYKGKAKYKVSNLGRVKRIYKNGKEKILYKTDFNFKENKYIGTTPGYVHRLVAFYFISKPIDDSLEVNHKNFIRNDNRVENLEWMTHKENEMHAWKLNHKKARNLKGENNPMFGHIGAYKGKFGKDHNQSKALVQLDKNYNLVNKFYSLKEAGKYNNFNRKEISKACNSKKLYKEYYWMFLKEYELFKTMFEY